MRSLSLLRPWRFVRAATILAAFGALSLYAVLLIVGPAGADTTTAIVAAVPATPTAGTSGIFDLGAALGAFGPFVNSIVGALISALITWAVWLVNTKTGLNIDAAHRDSLNAWAQRQASSIVAQGLVSVSGLKVSVGSPVIASLANSAARRIPDALKGLGLTPDEAAARVVDWLPHVPTVASLTAAQATAKAA